jgi:hypothetical protein
MWCHNGSNYPRLVRDRLSVERKEALEVRVYSVGSIAVRRVTSS